MSLAGGRTERLVCRRAAQGGRSLVWPSGRRRRGRTNRRSAGRRRRCEDANVAHGGSRHPPKLDKSLSLVHFRSQLPQTTSRCKLRPMRSFSCSNERCLTQPDAGRWVRAREACRRSSTSGQRGVQVNLPRHLSCPLLRMTEERTTGFQLGFRSCSSDAGRARSG